MAQFDLMAMPNPNFIADLQKLNPTLEEKILWKS